MQAQQMSGRGLLELLIFVNDLYAMFVLFPRRGFSHRSEMSINCHDGRSCWMSVVKLWPILIPIALRRRHYAQEKPGTLINYADNEEQ